MACLESYLVLLILVKGSLCATTEMTSIGDNNKMSTVGMSTSQNSMETTVKTMDMNATKEVMSESTIESSMLSTMPMTTATKPLTTMSTTVPTTMSTTVPTTMSTTVPTTMSTTTLTLVSTTPCPVCTEAPNFSTEESRFGTHGLIGISITLAIALLLLIILVVMIVRRRMKSQRYDPSNKGQPERRMEGVPLSMPMNNTFSGDFGPNVTTIDLEDENNTKTEPKVGNGAGLSSFGGGKSQEASTEDIDNLPKPSWLTVEPSDNTKASTESLHSSDKMMQPDPNTNTPDKLDQDQLPEPTAEEEPVLVPPPDTDSENDTNN